MKKKALVVVDMQNDFIDGSLSNDEAKKIVPNVVKLIEEWPNKSHIFVTQDSHTEDYLNTSEGKKLPVKHCIIGTDGWLLNKEVQEALDKKFTVMTFGKPVFGSTELIEWIKGEKRKYDEIIVCGLVLSICVLANAVLLKTHFPDTKISVKLDCTADINETSFEAAKQILMNQQIDLI